MSTTTEADALARLLDPPSDACRAERLLRRAGGPHRLRTADVAWLVAELGLRPSEAERVRAAFQLGAAALAAPLPDRLRHPERVAARLAFLSLRDVEELWVLPVDAGLRVLSARCVAQGGRAACTVDGVDVLRPAVAAGALGLFLGHNHPSGDPTPSEADRRFTRRTAEQAELLGLELHDHLVVAGDRWASCLGRRSGRLRADAPGEEPPRDGGDEQARHRLTAAPRAER